MQDSEFDTSDRLTLKRNRLAPGRIQEMERVFGDLLDAVGEDRHRQGLEKTPGRAARSFEFLTQGYRICVEDVVNGAIFDSDASEIVMVKDIELYSMCEHHLLPFIGRAHVAYIPDGKVIGLSKVARIVDLFARRLQIQERLTQEIAQNIQTMIDPYGVGVICEARHFCMMMRGVEKQHSGAVTSAMLGAFRDCKETRDEFLALAGRSEIR